MTSHWEFLNQVLCEDIVRHVIQQYLLPSVETSNGTHKSKWKKVMAEVEYQYWGWRDSWRSHILAYYSKFYRPTSAELEFYFNHVDKCDLDSHFPKIVEILPPRFRSFTAYLREPDDSREIQLSVYCSETDEIIFSNASWKWVNSLRPWWWWKLRKSYETTAYYLRRARYRLSCC